MTADEDASDELALLLNQTGRWTGGREDGGHLALKNLADDHRNCNWMSRIILESRLFSTKRKYCGPTPRVNYASTATSLWTATFTSNVWWKQTPWLAWWHGRHEWHRAKDKSGCLSPTSPCDRISVPHTQFTIISYLLFRRVTNRRKFCSLTELIAVVVFNVHLTCILWPNLLNQVSFDLLPHLWTITPPLINYLNFELLPHLWTINYLTLSYFTLIYPTLCPIDNLARGHTGQIDKNFKAKSILKNSPSHKSFMKYTLQEHGGYTSAGLQELAPDDQKLKTVWRYDQFAGYSKYWEIVAIHPWSYMPASLPPLSGLPGNGIRFSTGHLWTTSLTRPLWEFVNKLLPRFRVAL